jgi:hypothetical protein
LDIGACVAKDGGRLGRRDTVSGVCEVDGQIAWPARPYGVEMVVLLEFAATCCEISARRRMTVSLELGCNWPTKKAATMAEKRPVMTYSN